MLLLFILSLESLLLDRLLNKGKSNMAFMGGKLPLSGRGGPPSSNVASQGQVRPAVPSGVLQARAAAIAGNMNRVNVPASSAQARAAPMEKERASSHDSTIEVPSSIVDTNRGEVYSRGKLLGKVRLYRWLILNLFSLIIMMPKIEF